MYTKANYSVHSRYASPSMMKRIATTLHLQSKRVMYRLAGYFLTHQRFPRLVFARLRAIWPIFVFGGFVLVTRNADVRSVLNRNRDFELGEFARERMLAGRFILEIDWPRSHDVQEEILHAALRDYKGPDVSGITAKVCQAELEKASGQADVAALARSASMAVVERYFGFSFDADGANKLEQQLTALASAIVLLPPNGTPERKEVECAADALNCHVHQLINDQIASGWVGKGDLLSRLQAQANGPKPPEWLDHDWVARMICGLTVFSMATVVRTASDVVDELLRQPKPVLTGAVKTAKQANEDPAPLRMYIYEALRFRPMLPVLARFCPRTTIIGTPGKHRRIVRAGATVWAPPLAAMHDGQVFPEPGRFLPERQTNQSLVFGLGLHECIGRNIAEKSLIEIVGAVLRQPNLRRLPGKSGRIKYRGAAAVRLQVGI